MQALDRARDAVPPGYPAEQLMLTLRIRHDKLAELLQDLSDLGIVARTQWEGQERWVLACNPNTKELGPLFDRLALDRQALQKIEQPNLIPTLIALLQNNASPVVADVLLQHDKPVEQPLQ